MRYWTLFLLLFEWQDFWVGVYWDKKKRKLYILPIPTCGIAIQFGSAPPRVVKEEDVAQDVMGTIEIECPDCQTICRITSAGFGWVIFCEKCYRTGKGSFSQACFKEFGGKINGLEVEKIFPYRP
jgi:hypothetical protein